MLNSVVVLIFSVLDWKNSFWGNLVQRNQNYKLKFDTTSNSNMLNSMMILIFSVLDFKCLLGTFGLKKVKIICINWNLATSLIRIYWSWWWCLFFLFWTGNTIFWVNLFQKFKFVCLKWNLVHIDLFQYPKFSDNIHFFCIEPEIPFFEKLFLIFVLTNYLKFLKALQLFRARC